MSILRRLFVLFLTVAVVFAQDEGKAVAEVGRAFRPQKRGKAAAPAEERKQALAALGTFDSPAAAEALCDAWRSLDAELQDVDGERAAASAELAGIQGEQAGNRQRTFPVEVKKRHDELQALLGELRTQADALRELQQDVGKALGALHERPTLLFLLQHVVDDKRCPLPLRIAAARAVGDGAGEVIEELAAALQRARETEERIALLDALALAGSLARPHADDVIALLKHKEEAVRERAALALAKIAVPQAIAPMIELLQQSSGQTRLRIVAALEVLTKQQHGLNVPAWQQWWAAEGERVLAAGPSALGGGIPSNRKKTNENYYFGIPQDQSDGILYVLDCSDSMKAPVDFQPPGTGTVAAGTPTTQTRLDACKKELIRALGMLQPTQRFAILWYNDLPHWYQQKLLPATKENVAAAQAFVAGLKHASSTNIHDSLEQGFTLVGRGVRDKYYGVELDTIFLLTDGSPTKPTGQPDSTETILTSVRSWNPLRRVTIHTIGIGKGLNEPFLMQLARENGGEFKKF